jgi:hypothetical protein
MVELMKNARFSAGEIGCEERFATSSPYFTLLKSGLARAAAVLSLNALNRLRLSHFRMKATKTKSAIPAIGCHIQRITAAISKQLAIANTVAFSATASD